MKNFLLSTVLLMVGSVALAQATVTIEYDPRYAGMMQYCNIPLSDGRYFTGNGREIKVDRNGQVTLKVDLKKPGIVYVYGPRNLVDVWVEPNTSIVLNLLGEPGFEGDLKDENTLLQTVRTNRDKWGDYWNSLDQFQHFIPRNEVTLRLNKFIADNEKLVDDLVRKEKVSPAFVAFVRVEIQMSFYNEAFKSLIDGYGQNLLPLEKAAKDMKELFSGGRNQNSMTTLSSMKTLVRQFHIDVLEKDSTVASIQKIIASELDKPAQEFFTANFVNDPIAWVLKADVLAMYNKFKKDFPQSSYLKPLQPSVERLKD